MLEHNSESLQHYPQRSFSFQTTGAADLPLRISGFPSSVPDRSAHPSSGLRAFLPISSSVTAELFSGLFEQSGPHRSRLEEEDGARRKCAARVRIVIAIFMLSLFLAIIMF